MAPTLPQQKLYTLLLFTGLGAVYAIFWLISELYMCTTNDMLIHLLDRVEALEKSRQNTAGVDRSEEPSSSDQPR